MDIEKYRRHASRRVSMRHARVRAPRRASKHLFVKMIYSIGVAIWIAFLSGLAAGGLIVGLWMRARIARVEVAKQFADHAISKLNETFQSLADASLRSNQTAFLEAARATLDSARVPMTGQLAQNQTAI